MGIGYWEKLRKTAIDGFADDVAKFNKVSKVLAVLTVAIQVGDGVYTDINRGYSTDRVISNGVVNTLIYGTTMFVTGWAGAQAGAWIGTMFPIPIVGTFAGAAIGFALGTLAGLLMDYEVNGKSLIDHCRDWFYDTWTNWID